MSGAIPIAADQLSALVARLFIAAGVPDTAARTVAGALVDADLEGQSSHGVMLVEMYLDRIRKGSVSLKQAGEIVSDKGATVVLDAHTCARPSHRRPGDQNCGRTRPAFRCRSGRGASRLPFRDCPAFCAEGRRRGLHRHRHVQHAPADAGAGRRRTCGGKQSDCDRRAVRWPGAHRARHGDERSRDGQDPHGREGGGEDPRHLGGQGRRQRDNGPRAKRLPACCCRRAGRKASGSPF